MFNLPLTVTRLKYYVLWMYMLNTIFENLESIKEKWWQWAEIGIIIGVRMEKMQPSSGHPTLGRPTKDLLDLFLLNFRS